MANLKDAKRLTQIMAQQRGHTMTRFKHMPHGYYMSLCKTCFAYVEIKKLLYGGWGTAGNALCRVCNKK